jgi:hypothetical protein
MAQNKILIDILTNVSKRSKLAKGSHTIHFKSSLICSDPDCADPNFVRILPIH